MPRYLSGDAARPVEGRVAVVVSRYNETITTRLLHGALETLAEAGVDDRRIDVCWTPGAWELPLIAQELARGGRHAAIVCLGAVIRGETTHDEHINRQVSLSLGQIALAGRLPVAFGVLTCNTLEQALQRAGGNVGNKGREATEAALEMARLMGLLRTDGATDSIGSSGAATAEPGDRGDGRSNGRTERPLYAPAYYSRGDAPGGSGSSEGPLARRRRPAPPVLRPRPLFPDLDLPPDATSASTDASDANSDANSATPVESSTPPRAAGAASDGVRADENSADEAPFAASDGSETRGGRTAPVLQPQLDVLARPTRPAPPSNSLAAPGAVKAAAQGAETGKSSFKPGGARRGPRVRRRRAREVVLQMLYADDVNPSRNLVEADAFLRRRLSFDSQLVAFASSLLAGVRRNRPDLDQLLGRQATNWSLQRMAVTDRNVLRLGAYELLHTDTPRAVAINEAVELARRYGNRQSAQFVNGILDRLQAGRRSPGAE